MLGKIKRIYIQLSSAIFFNLPFLSAYLKYAPVPVLNCYACPLAAGACPIGSLQYFFTIGQVPVLTIGALLLFGLLLGRFYCGYLCPFGLVQDVLFKLSKKKKILPRWFAYLKYAVLAIFVIILPLVFLSPIFCKICPAGTLEAAIPIVSADVIKKISGTLPFGYSAILGMIGVLFFIKGMLLIITLIGSVFYKRPFCKLCPLGAVFSFFNRFRFVRNLQFNSHKCTRCNLCINKCPAGINPTEALNHHDCLQCDECAQIKCGAISKKL